MSHWLRYYPHLMTKLLKSRLMLDFLKWNCVKMKSVKADMCKVTKKTEEMDESFSETTIKSVTSQLDWTGLKLSDWTPFSTNMELVLFQFLPNNSEPYGLFQPKINQFWTPKVGSQLKPKKEIAGFPQLEVLTVTKSVSMSYSTSWKEKHRWVLYAFLLLTVGPCLFFWIIKSVIKNSQ